MNCPFCGKEMQEGAIPAMRSPLIWRGKNLSGEDVYLTNTPILFSQEAAAFYCPDCRQIILPVPELESFSDKMEQKLDAVTEKISSVAQEFKEQRDEKRKEKETKKRKGKDPWEL